MMNISNDERNLIIRRTASAVSQLQEGEDAIRVLSRIYCQNLPDKSPRQGELMAREVLTWMGKFQQGFEEAVDSPEEYVHRQLSEALADLPMEQQCAVLRQQIREFSALDALDTLEEQDLAKVHQPSRQTQPVSEQIRDALLWEASRKIGGENHKHELRSFLPPDPAAIRNRNAAKACIGEDMLLAVTSMVIYTMAKKGELSGLPKEVSLSQIVIGVCTEEKYRQISHAQQFGYLSEEKAKKQNDALWAVCFTLLIVAAVGLAVGLITKIITDIAWAALAAYILLWLGTMLTIAYSAANEMVVEDADEIAQIPVQLHPVEEAEVPQQKQPEQKHIPLPTPVRKKQLQKKRIPQPLYQKNEN